MSCFPEGSLLWSGVEETCFGTGSNPGPFRISCILQCSIIVIFGFVVAIRFTLVAGRKQVENSGEGILCWRLLSLF